jgi:hypothetical protein
MVALENGMGFQVNLDIQITRRAAIDAGLAFA